jgi:hypothetical protein
MPESEPSPELAKVKAKIAASDPLVRMLVRMLDEAAARSDGKPLVSRGSFAQYAEDDDV